MASKRTTAIAGILMGDELGLIKRIDLQSTPSTSSITTLNRDHIEGELTPERSIISIKPFTTHSIAEAESDSSDSDEDMTGKKPSLPPMAAYHAEMSMLFLITSKPNRITLFNSMTNRFINVKPPLADADVHLIGAQPINRNNIVVCYDNGTIFTQNIEKELLESSAAANKAKAIKLLGIEMEPDRPASAGSVGSRKRKNRSQERGLDRGDHNQGNGREATPPPPQPPEPKLTSDSAEVLFQPNWNPAQMSLTCFEVCANRLAVAGKGVELKVFDLETRQCIFTAKPAGKDWLGLKTPVWVSDVTWIGPILPPKFDPNKFRHKTQASPIPAMIATCSRTDPVIRIYDTKSKTRKALWNINLKENTFNNDSNPPSFTSIASTSSPITSAVPTQQLILGTTMGRMIAIDLHFNSHSHRQLGVFKGFGGGAIRDIGFVPNCGSIGNHKIISCSLDRFIRIHTFRTGANHKRQLDQKYYVKTRPTCIQPIISTYMVDGESEEVDSMANVDESDPDDIDDYDE